MSDQTKDLLKTIAIIAITIILCGYAFVFLMRGSIELSKEFRPYFEKENITAQAAGAQRWITYIPPTKDFKILFPHTPEVGTFTESEAILTSYRAQGDNELFQVDRLTMFNPISTFIPEDLTAFVQNLAMRQGKKIESLYIDTATLRVSFILVGQQHERLQGVVIPANQMTIYILRYECPEEWCRQDRYDYFVDTFDF